MPFGALHNKEDSKSCLVCEVTRNARSSVCRGFKALLLCASGLRHHRASSFTSMGYRAGKVDPGSLCRLVSLEARLDHRFDQTFPPLDGVVPGMLSEICHVGYATTYCLIVKLKLLHEFASHSETACTSVLLSDIFCSSCTTSRGILAT